MAMLNNQMIDSIGLENIDWAKGGAIEIVIAHNYMIACKESVM